MTYRIVHSWGDSEEFGETGLPVPGVVEDDDGIRILLVPDESVRGSHYRRACKLGIQALLLLTEHERAFILRPDFAESRTEDDGYYRAPEGWWSSLDDDVDPQPDYLVLRGIQKTRIALPQRGFVNLHNHTEFSGFDGYQTTAEMVARALADNQPAVAMTDHGTVAGHPELQKLAKLHGFRPIFGVEAYLVPDRFARDTDKWDYWHICLWATDNASLQRLWALCTEAERDGKRDGASKPCIDWDTLERLGEGLLASSGCLGGPIANPLLQGDPELATANLARLMGLFPDRFYIELHANRTDDQVLINKSLVELATLNALPVIAVSDCHYAHPRDKADHKVWLAVQLAKNPGDTKLFDGEPDLHLHTENQARAALDYLPDGVVEQAITNTVRLAERCTAEIVSKPSTPTYSRDRGEFATRQERDAYRLAEAIEAAWDRTRGKPHPQKVYRKRIAEEFDLLEAKHFCGYVLMLMDLIKWAKDHGILVGPGRGSGGGSLVLYVLSITEIDPVEHDLLFARFMTPGRTALPDVDTDFPSSKKGVMLERTQERWGPDRVVSVGTHLRLQNKGAINKTAQAFRNLGVDLPPESFTDLQQVSKLIDQAEGSSAGLGISWEELWTVHGDELEPYRDKYPELFEAAGRLRGRLSAYGKHAAGVVIDPDTSIEGALPLRAGEAGAAMVTQFDMDALEQLGYVKFDFLNLRTLDTLQMAVDLIERDTGHRIDFRTWRGEYRDPEVFQVLSDGWTKGVFQIETPMGTRMAKRFGPTTLAELADVITLVRPGPMNSGLTEAYLLRRAGEQPVTFDDPRLERVLAKTYGLMIYQEDIMATCMVLAGYDENEADEVRKILGKKQVEKVAAAGRKFIARAVANDTDPQVAERLWVAMAEFAKYSFNRAHAFAYAVLGYWTAWFKVHYPVQMMCALLSTVDKNDIGDYVEEARRLGIDVLPPDINTSGVGFTSTATGVRYGLASINGIGEKAVEAVLASRPYASYADFIERRSTKCNMGAVKLLVRVGAFDSLQPNRRGLEAFIAAEEQPGTARCRFLSDTQQTIIWAPKLKQMVGPDARAETETEVWQLPCSFDWPNEPREEGKPNSKGQTKLKPAKSPSKRCTRSCRRFSPEPPPDPAGIEPYTDGDIGAIEQELLGVRLSTSEFDRIPAEMLDDCATADQVQVGEHGDYLVAALIRSVRKKKDRNNNEFAWISLTLRSGGIDNIIVFASKYEMYANHLKHPGLVFVTLRKGERGLALVEIDPAL